MNPIQLSREGEGVAATKNTKRSKFFFISSCTHYQVSCSGNKQSCISEAGFVSPLRLIAPRVAPYVVSLSTGYIRIDG
jgi:hypothetical protein